MKAFEIGCIKHGKQKLVTAFNGYSYCEECFNLEEDKSSKEKRERIRKERHKKIIDEKIDFLKCKQFIINPIVMLLVTILSVYAFFELFNTLLFIVSTFLWFVFALAFWIKLTQKYGRQIKELEGELNDL